MSNITCQECSLLALEKNLCSSCNNEKTYYHKKEENNNQYKNCYNSTTIPKNYILQSNIYEPCYDSCASCGSIGNKTKHECKECKEGYLMLNNDGNCYEKCNHYYYFNDAGKYVCLRENKCPPNYKLINSTNKCILKC